MLGTVAWSNLLLYLNVQVALISLLRLYSTSEITGGARYLRANGRPLDSGCCSEESLAASALLSDVTLCLGLGFGLLCPTGSFSLGLALIQFSFTGHSPCPGHSETMKSHSICQTLGFWNSEAVCLLLSMLAPAWTNRS